MKLLIKQDITCICEFKNNLVALLMNCMVVGSLFH